MRTDDEQVVTFALGSNLGQRQDTISQACLALERELGPARALSSTIATIAVVKPTTITPQPEYLNAVVQFEVRCDPFELLSISQMVELSLGRKKNEKKLWLPRTIDIDLITVGTCVIDSPDLTLPHPACHEREFVLQPLIEIDQRWMHPIFKVTARELLARLRHQ